mgnify:CR=1 FL=1
MIDIKQEWSIIENDLKRLFIEFWINIKQFRETYGLSYDIVYDWLNWQRHLNDKNKQKLINAISDLVNRNDWVIEKLLSYK